MNIKKQKKRFKPDASFFMFRDYTGGCGMGIWIAKKDRPVKKTPDDQEGR